MTCPNSIDRYANQPLLPEQLTLQTWQQLMPLIEQSIEMDKAGGYLFFRCC